MSYRMKTWPLGCLAVLVVLFLNVWMWDNDALVLGLPINLLYHVALCVLASLVMWGIVKKAWPDHLDDGEGGE